MTSCESPLNAGFRSSVRGCAKNYTWGDARDGGLTQDGRVGREDGKVGVEFLRDQPVNCVLTKDVALLLASVTYIEIVQLVGSHADGVCKEQHIALQPSNGLGRVLEADTGTRHCADIST